MEHTGAADPQEYRAQWHMRRLPGFNFRHKDAMPEPAGARNRSPAGLMSKTLR